ncbi:2Fe-2S iron-sulfur cluster-binding protein [Vibrio fluvialis]|uniref:2Fe-2S iron-sulfur cluster-binding protein n=1 Tax=Vibrio fluvialis TaxID=676 RepID=UPI0023B0F9B1|nr:2Fe-2S iron-sulfur cluster binding domain-containing protein [Vibrio fluvialis]
MHRAKRCTLPRPEAGLTIPKACGMGICGTCKVNKVSGNVEMLHNGGITDEDVAEGYILSCCSIPTDNVIVEYRANGH